MNHDSVGPREMRGADAAAGRGSLRALANCWEKRREPFKLRRGKRSFSEVVHKDHKW